MICPACKNTLTTVAAGDITVDVCKGGCAGLWFDNFELKKVDEPHENAGEALLNIERNPQTKVDPAAKRTCPKCKNVVMIKHYFSVKREVEIDECSSCGGIWLDAGELRQIRNQYKSEAERQKAAGEYFGEVSGKQVEAKQAESQNKLEKSQKVAQALKFITPSYYIKGKQGGGAF